jgi:undecaprenyl diphosphate synthase
MTNIPHHVGIIMDGNGRWAQARGLPRAEGHRQGVITLRKAVRLVGEAGVKILTIYSFSSENWSRPTEEVGLLMGLLKRFIKNDLKELHSEGVRVKIIGSRKGLDADIVELIDDAEKLTDKNTALTLLVAFNYGGREEIVQAALKCEGDITESNIAKHIYTSEFPDPDLIIRTSGEERLSNFLLWQSAYAEFVFLKVNWPDFDKPSLDEALGIYATRQRRFGGV